jgi:hypothetical protein
MTSVPGGASTGLPSMVSFTKSGMVSENSNRRR